MILVHEFFLERMLLCLTQLLEPRSLANGRMAEVRKQQILTKLFSSVTNSLFNCPLLMNEHESVGISKVGSVWIIYIRLRLNCLIGELNDIDKRGLFYTYISCPSFTLNYDNKKSHRYGLLQRSETFSLVINKPNFDGPVLAYGSTRFLLSNQNSVFFERYSTNPYRWQAPKELRQTDTFERTEDLFFQNIFQQTL